MGRRKKSSMPIDFNRSSKFSVEHLESILRDIETGRLKLDKIVVGDDIQVGLRAIIRKTGSITYHVNYAVGGARPYMKLGEHPEMTIPEARRLAEIVQTLASYGIDVQEGLHKRLIRELKEQGAKWRP